MAYAFDLGDVAFLSSPEGADAVRRLSERALTTSSRMADVRAARELVGDDLAAAALETAVLRCRAASKVDFAGRGLFTDDALQQATPSAVARHRAQRLAGRDVHDVTCSVGADLHEISAVAGRCIGSDVDEVRLRMARHNLRGAAALVRADALRPVTTAAAVLADPGRRAGGRRRWDPQQLEPPLDELLAAHRGRDLVVKSAPGMDFDAVPDGAEIELVSLDGGVREASLWFGDLATPRVRRRASVLTTGGASWTVTDADPDGCPTREVGSWLVDPDGAVVRAGLVRQYAARHGLGQLDPRIAYLTGEAPPPGIRAFRVLQQVRYGDKHVRAALRQHDVGRLEILVRGLDVDPDALRRRLKPRGEQQATLVLTRIGENAVGFLCRAEVVDG